MYLPGSLPHLQGWCCSCASASTWAACERDSSVCPCLCISGVYHVFVLSAHLLRLCSPVFARLVCRLATSMLKLSHLLDFRSTFKIVTESKFLRLRQEHSARTIEEMFLGELMYRTTNLGQLVTVVEFLTVGLWCLAIQPSDTTKSSARSRTYWIGCIFCSGSPALTDVRCEVGLPQFNSVVEPGSKAITWSGVVDVL